MKIVRNAAEARELWLDMEKKRVQPDGMAYKFYIEALRKDKSVQPDEIENAVILMKAAGFNEHV